MHSPSAASVPASVGLESETASAKGFSAVLSPALGRGLPRGVSGWNIRWVTVHWEYLLPIVAVHALALFALLPWCFSWSGLVIALVGTHVFGMGINLGYHRLLTHRSLKVPVWLERTLATIALCCLEDTPARWVATHRLHHVYSDKPEDPHTPRDGASWSHVGWLFRRAPDRRTLSFLDKYARDILADRYFRFLERHPTSTLWIYMAHAAVFFLAGLVAGRIAGGGWSAGVQLGTSWLVWGAFVRTVLVWHMTWAVNSLSHLFGYQNYPTGEDSRNNWFVAMVAAGEGWHNNHHHDPASASLQHKWWEFDLTYYEILLLKRLGLATDIIQPRHVRRSAASARI